VGGLVLFLHIEIFSREESSLTLLIKLLVNKASNNSSRASGMILNVSIISFNKKKIKSLSAQLL
jgi:hypothetical protein